MQVLGCRKRGLQEKQQSVQVCVAGYVMGRVLGGTKRSCCCYEGDSGGAARPVTAGKFRPGGFSLQVGSSDGSGAGLLNCETHNAVSPKRRALWCGYLKDCSRRAIEKKINWGLSQHLQQRRLNQIGMLGPTRDGLCFREQAEYSPEGPRRPASEGGCTKANSARVGGGKGEFVVHAVDGGDGYRTIRISGPTRKS